MSIIIRLQNLPWSANALDIRQFFSGLSIPEGGVHIVGGELGDAFIAFSTDEDARQAFNRNGGKIKEVQIKLMLSSRTEMQKVIEAARNPLTAFMQAATAAPPASQLLPTPVPANLTESKADSDNSRNDNKRDRRRSRSRSRDRKDRDRRDRRRRDRSRSRSRDYRDRRRRDRSHSREKRSKDRDRRSRDRKRSEDRSSPANKSGTKAKPVGVWEDPVMPTPAVVPVANVLGAFFPNALEESRRNPNTFAVPASIPPNRNGFPSENFNQRDAWQANDNGFPRPGDLGMRSNFQGGALDNMSRNFAQNPNFNNDRVPYNNRMVPEGANRAFVPQPGKPPLLDRPYPIDMPNGSCVMVRPFYGGYGEIRRLFQGLFINNKGIKFVNDEFGNSTGIVYVRFALPDGKAEALSRNGTVVRNQMIEIHHLDDEVFENATDRYHPDNNENDDHPEGNNYPPKPNYNFSPNRSTSPPQEVSTIVVENLPSYVKEQDIMKVFTDYALSSIFIGSKNRRPIAYVKFASADDARKVQADNIKHVMDGKPLTVRLCTNEDTHTATDMMEEQKSAASQDGLKPKGSDCVALTGLPPKTTDRDITDFFSDVAIVPHKVHLLTTNTGFSGDAFCEFASPEEAHIALDKDGVPLGSGTVAVKAVPRAEMEVTIGVAPGPRKMLHPPHMPHGPNPNPNPNARPYYHRPYFAPRGHAMMGPRPPMKRFPPQPHMSGEVGVPGSTVLMENVPYKAGLDEILEFFAGYDIPADNVLRRYNENGTPSGEAKVIFESPKDAVQAINDKQHQQIRDRTIYLCMC